jgi:hypothetical protein
LPRHGSQFPDRRSGLIVDLNKFGDIDACAALNLFDLPYVLSSEPR